MGLGTCLTGNFCDEPARQFFQMEKTGWEILYAVAIGALPQPPATSAPKAEPLDQTGLWRG
jgi:nitroreductase